MSANIEQIKAKIREFHPEIEQQGVNLTVGWDEADQRYILKLGKGGEEVGAFLERKDVEECLAGRKCVNPPVQVTQLLAELEDLISPRKPG